MSTPSSPPPSYSSICTAAPASWLPTEVFMRVLSHLQQPLDLYHASLVSRSWRAVATHPQLWAEHYWAIYRVRSYPETDEERLLAGCRTATRRKAMRSWIALSAASPSPNPSGAFDASSPPELAPLDEPSLPGLLKAEGIQSCDSIEGLSRRLCEAKIEQQGGDEETEKTLPLEQRVKASTYGLKRDHLSYPAFLTHQTQEERELGPSPDFYAIFARKLNQDQRLLDDLRTHVALDSNMLDSLLNLVERYGDAARDLLFALCAHQQLTEQSIRAFVDPAGPYGTGGSSRWPRALDVHTQGTSSQAQPHLDGCISVRSAAEQVLGHLQRRDALRQMRKLQARRSGQLPAMQTLSDRVRQGCMDVEEALQAMALFRLGEPSEISSYLDLVALHVWEELTASARWKIDDRCHSPPQGGNASQSATTRQRVLCIVDALHRLGFSNAGPNGRFVPSGCFLNGPLYCPNKVSASQNVTGAILCAVLRRLGVAAALTNARGYLVVVEEGEKPHDWLESHGEWQQFFLLPRGNGGPHQLREVTSTLDSVADLSYDARGGRSAEESLRPASHIDIWQSVAIDIVREVQRTGGTFVQTHAREVETAVTQPTDAPSLDLRTDLLNHLLGRAACPPWPLVPAVLPSSFAVLGTRTGDWHRPNFRDSLQDAAYCTLWILCVGELGRPRARERGNDFVAEFLQIASHVHCDLPLLLEAEGCDVKEHLGLVRKAMKMAGRVGGAATYAGRLAGCSSPSQKVKNLLASIFGDDVGPNEGLGGYGGCDRGERERGLLDPAHERNAAVQHRVGTVFTHRQHGFRAVVIGWDCCHTSKNSSLSTELQGQTEREQPFYHAIREDGSRVYVAQSNVQVARIPTNSTVEEANTLLRGYLPLFTLREVERCFATISVAPWKRKTDRDEGKEKKEEEEEGIGVAASDGGEIKMVMNPWMRQAWPFG